MKAHRRRIEAIVKQLKKNSRLNLPELASLTKIPLTVIYTILVNLKEDYHFTIIKKTKAEKGLERL